MSLTTLRLGPEDISQGASILRRGGLLGIPTGTVYGLGADGRNPRAVEAIFAAKGRPQDNPLILHIPGADWLERYCGHIPPQAYALAERFWPGPLTIILKRRPCVPDVVTAENDAVSDEEQAALMAAARDAVAGLDAFRIQEGAILIADLLRRVDEIEACREQVVPFEKARTENIRARILDNLAKLPVEADSNRLEQEMIFYLEKLDITEEKVRLANHCKYFREVAASEEGAGRKLGFIAQEMGREINTMGSKANETNIQILVVRMKDELEKIKEQVLNIL